MRVQTGKIAKWILLMLFFLPLNPLYFAIEGEENATSQFTFQATTDKTGESLWFLLTLVLQRRDWVKFMGKREKEKVIRWRFICFARVNFYWNMVRIEYKSDKLRWRVWCLEEHLLLWGWWRHFLVRYLDKIWSEDKKGDKLADVRDNHRCVTKHTALSLPLWLEYWSTRRQ